MVLYITSVIIATFSMESNIDKKNVEIPISWIIALQRNKK